MTDDVALLLRRAGFGPTAAELAAREGGGLHRRRSSAHCRRPAPTRGVQGADSPARAATRTSGLPDPPPPQRAAADAAASASQTDRHHAVVAGPDDRRRPPGAREAASSSGTGTGRPRSKKVHPPAADARASTRRCRRSPRDFVGDGARAWCATRRWSTGWTGSVNTARRPNENLARELMELFMLGIGDYTERDVKEAGRALTGWQIDSARARDVLRARAGTTRRARPSSGTGANFDAHSLVDHLLRQPACPRFIAARLWFRYASSDQADPGADQRADGRGVPRRPRRCCVRCSPTTRSRRPRARWSSSRSSGWSAPCASWAAARRAHRSSTANQILDGLPGSASVPFAPAQRRRLAGRRGVAHLRRAAQVRLSLAGKLAGLAARRAADRRRRGVPARRRQLDRPDLRGADARRRDPRQLLTLGLVSPEYLVT